MVKILYALVLIFITFLPVLEAIPAKELTLSKSENDADIVDDMPVQRMSTHRSYWKNFWGDLFHCKYNCTGAPPPRRRPIGPSPFGQPSIPPIYNERKNDNPTHWDTPKSKKEEDNGSDIDEDDNEEDDDDEEDEGEGEDESEDEDTENVNDNENENNDDTGEDVNENNDDKTNNEDTNSEYGDYGKPYPLTPVRPKLNFK